MGQGKTSVKKLALPGELVRRLEQEHGLVLSEFLRRQRWFGGKGRSIKEARVADVIPFPEKDLQGTILLVEVIYAGGEEEVYVVAGYLQPGSAHTEERAETESVIVSDPTGSGLALIDATRASGFWMMVLDGIKRDRVWDGTRGRWRFLRTEAGAAWLAESPQEAKTLSAEQSNTSVLFDRRLIFKLIRKLEHGVNPDYEISEFLATRTAYRHVPLLVGGIVYEWEQTGRSQTATAGVLQRFVPNVGDGWSYTLAHLKGLLQEAEKLAPSGVEQARSLIQWFSNAFADELYGLGRITGGLHVALASAEDLDAFRPEPIGQDDAVAWQRAMSNYVGEVMGELRAAPLELKRRLGLTDEELSRLESVCRDKHGALSLLVRAGAAKMRHHGDFHLGQVLKTSDGFVMLDFEGEPARSLPERREKVCPLKDVAGMLRSFDYAAHAAMKQARVDSAWMSTVIDLWQERVRDSFLAGYFSAAVPGDAAFLPKVEEDARAVIRVFELDKAVYELRYELRNRPDWLDIPLGGIRRLLELSPRRGPE